MASASTGGGLRFAKVAARRVWGTFWFVPSLYVLVALVLSIGLIHWDQVDPIQLSRSINPSSATSALSALASGMLAFTGFVTSVILLVLQFGSTQFSPRFVARFRRNRTLVNSLSTFTATFLFALVSTAQVGRGADAFVPTRTLIAALLLTLLSILMFFVLMNGTSDGLRVARVVQTIDSAARDAFDAVYPSSASDAAAAQAVTHSLADRTPLQTLRLGPVGRVVVAIDQAGVADLAQRHEALVELVPAVGDHVPGGGKLLNVYGAHELPEHRLRRYVALGDERTLDDDPAFAIRMLVDVAIKALSPAINDPTTAVQSLDRIEDLLRYAAAKHLSVGVVADSQGTARLVYPTPTWDDLVQLALDEIRAFGAAQYQVARRMRALLDDLIADVPERRAPTLQRQSDLLEDAVASAIPESQRADAVVADRQGIGMARHGSHDHD
jgi:uncharacterized membrane protein